MAGQVRETPWERLGGFVGEHAVFLAVLIGYFSAAAIFFVAIGKWDEWTIRPAYPLWLLAALTFSCGRLFVARVSKHADSPLWRTETIAGALLVLGVTVPFQTTFSSIKLTIAELRGFPWDPTLSDLDRLLHAGRQPADWVLWMAQDRLIADWIDRLYLWWFPLVSLFVFWAAWTPLRRLRQRALISTLLVWIVCGNLAAFALASAGPCYYRFVAPGRPDPYTRLLTTLDLYARDGLWIQARGLQRTMWQTSADNPVGPLRGISAMPSVHVAMAVLLALVGWSRHWLAGVLLSAFAVATMLGSVVLAWHYAVDGYVGALMALAIWWLSARLVPTTPARRLPGNGTVPRS